MTARSCFWIAIAACLFSGLSSASAEPSEFGESLTVFLCQVDDETEAFFFETYPDGSGILRSHEGSKATRSGSTYSAIVGPTLIQIEGAAIRKVEEGEFSTGTCAPADRAVQSLVDSAMAIARRLMLSPRNSRYAQELDAELRAALAAKLAAEREVRAQMTAAEERQALLATARRELANSEAEVAASRREIQALTEQVSMLRRELGVLQALFDDVERQREANEDRIGTLNEQLNVALARAAEERRRREGAPSE